MLKVSFFATLLFVLPVLQGASQSYVPETNNDKVKIKPAVDIKAYSFPLSDVALLESPFKTAMEADTRFLLQLEADRLLADFRVHAGLKAKGERYGGWESSGLAGHTLGHYLSACAMQYAVSRDEEYRKRVNYIVDELAVTQQARKTGYVGAIPKEDSVFLEVSKGNITSRGFDLNGAWSPWYTVHKIMAGLLDAYLYCDNTKALSVNAGIADWTAGILKNLNDEQLQKMLFCEYGGMNEALVNTYAFTGEKKYLDLSYKFHDKRILDSLALKVNVLPGKHSNTQIPKVIGTLRRYELTTRQKDFVIADFFWNTVVGHHTYAPGGNSNYEYLTKPDVLSDKLTDNTMETCNTYNMLKLTRHLFALAPSAAYMNFYERALYNHILASQDHQNGMMCYFVPLRMGTKKEFSDPHHSFTCCVGSGIENHVKYGESIYFKGKDGSLYVNLFIPSTLWWKEREAVVTLKSNLPSESTVSLSLALKKSATFPLRIRKPGWVSGAVVPTVNGKAVTDAKVDAEGYIVISRAWKDKDVVTVEFPSSLYAMAMPDNARRQAFFYGPVMLAGNLGKAELDPRLGIPVLVTDKTDLTQWIKPVDKINTVFRTASVGAPGDVTLQPFYSIQDESYSVYWDVFTPAAWKVEEKAYEEKKQAASELAKRTVDELRVGEMQPERDHNFTGDKTETGESYTRKWRVANDGGSFTFNMKVGQGTHTLICTYWGMDNRGRKFDILLDGQKIASEDLNRYKDSRFYDISYSIPPELLKGKKQVTFKFQANTNNQAGPVYGIRLVKDSE